MKRIKRKAIQDSENFWQLDGESQLDAITIPARPKAGVPTIVRLTHNNVYGPFENVDFFVRIGNPAEPTDPYDLDSAKNWVPARLVEELLYVNGREYLRSEYKKPLKDEASWDGTYEAELTFEKGKHSIEIKIVSGEPNVLRSLVLADWSIRVK